MQRRYFQSTRTASKPPSEAVGRQEAAEDGINAPRSNQNGGRNNASASWGAALEGKSQAGSGSWGQSVGSLTGHSPLPSETIPQASTPRLLPHEIRARALLLRSQQKSTSQSSSRNPSQQTERSRGSDPIARSLPTGWHQRQEREARSFEARDRWRDKETRTSPAHKSDDGRPRFSISRHHSGPRQGFESRAVLGQARQDTIQRTGEADPTNNSAWGSLRRKSNRNAKEAAAVPRKEPEQEDSRYTPLSSFRRDDDSRYQRQDTAHQDRNEQSRHRRSSFVRGREVPLTQNQMRLREQPQQEEPIESSFQQVTVNLNDADASAYTPPSRERERKRASQRSTYEPEESGRGRGKDRDKARRRQHFANNEEAEEAEAEGLARAEAKRLRKAQREAKKAETPTPILLPEFITIENLAAALKVRYDDFVLKLEDLGYEEVNRDYILNAENAGLIAGEYNFEAIIDRSESEDLKARDPAPDPSILPPRPPVVTIMGHVDHGKTTLLDYLRKSSVAAGEHGGITQHIGAFSVPMSGGKTITFLDTPGHAAFLSMRQRGANVTDIVILVVAADDSVKPQTIEAINHAKAAKVPIIVAINKIDKGDTNVQRVKQDLGRHGVELEDFGGDTQVVLVSGKTGQGMDELEEAAVTLSEILDMRAENDGPAEGWVLEASIKSMGKVATVLVRRGTMRVGDYIVAGQTWARIRTLRNEAGVEILEAGPGTPVEIDGWREQPLAGDEVLQASDEAKAKSVIDYRLEKAERDKMAEDMEAVNASRKAEQEKREREKAEAAAREAALESGEEVARKSADVTGAKQIYFIVKGDVSGSVEAVVDSLATLGNKEVEPHIIRSGVGQISEFDIEHAAAAEGYLINFNTTVEPTISQMAEKQKVKILDHNIIYRLVDDVKATLSEYLPPLVTQRVLGEAEVAQIFEIKLKGRQTKNIAGCKVRNGTVTKTDRVRVLRNGEKVFDGKSDVMFLFLSVC